MLKVLFVTFLALVSANFVSAQVRDGISISASNNFSTARSEVSFQKFKAYVESKGKPLDAGDYYTAFTIVPQFNLPTSGDCTKQLPFVDRLLKGVGIALAGVQKTRTDIVNLTVTKNSGATGPTQIISQTPLLYFGEGANPVGGAEAANTCFFGYMPTMREPYLKYVPGLNEEYDLTFSIGKSQTETSNLIGTLQTIEATVATFLSIASPTGAQITKLGSTLDGLQTQMTKAFSFGDQAPISQTLSMGGSSVYVSFVNNKDAPGSVVLYTRQSASIILDHIGKTIDYHGVFSNNEVVVPQCLRAAVSGAAGCPAAPQPTLYAGLSNYIGTEMPFTVFDLTTNDGLKAIPKTCDQIRQYTTGNLQLATMDALLVRWAAVKMGGLDVALANEQTLASIVKATQMPKEKIFDLCWNDQDADMLSTVATNMQKSMAN